MTTLESYPVIIAFEGLMYFQTNLKDKGKHVALVDAHCHHPILEVFSRNGQQKLEKHLSEDLKKGDVIKFDVAAGEIKRRGRYQKHVPDLRESILYGDIHEDVVNRKPHTGVATYVVLPPGELTTWHTLDSPVRLYKKDGSMKLCFARFVILETNVKYVDVVRTLLSPGEISIPPFPRHIIKPGDLIIVSNKGDASDKDLHFPEHTKLLTTYGLLGPIRIESDYNCDDYEEKTVRDEVEEVLRDHNPVPNADCGPTGP
jgi:hypothetical protein